MGNWFETVAIDRNGHEAQPGPRRRPVQPPAARILDGEGVVTLLGQLACEQHQALRDAGDDQDGFGRDDRAAHPAEVGSELDPESAVAERVGVAEVAVGEVADGIPRRGHPLAPREQCRIGPVRAQIELDEPGRCGRRCLLRGRLDPG